MKKALLLVLATLVSAVASARPVPPANVNFSSERGVPFGLVLDGQPLTRGVARQVHVDQLVPGLHWADFTIPAARGGAVRFRSRVWLEPGLETTFVLVARPGRVPVLQQAGAVALAGPGCATPGYGGPGSYDDGYGPDNYGGNYPSPNGGPGYGGQYNNNNAGPNQYNGGQYNNGSQYGNEPGAGYYPGSAVSSYRAMPPRDVDALIQAVQQRPFEATKLSTAKEALSQSVIQADDLKRLLRSFSFESSRVELAKYAYEHVADHQNFYRVYEAFDFDSSVQDVQRAVAQR